MIKAILVLFVFLLQACLASGEDRGAPSFGTVTPQSILHLEKQWNNSGKEHHPHVLCGKWELASADVKYFLVNAKKITAMELHKFYYTLPCFYSGSFSLGDEEYKFEINAGSYGVIYKAGAKSTAEIYGCRDLCESIFGFGLYGEGGEP